MVFEATSNVGDSWGGADESSHSLIILLDGQIAPNPAFPTIPDQR